MGARREQIRALLTTARARIDPCEVGIRRADRLRSPGLRREDVAVLAGVDRRPTETLWRTIQYMPVPAMVMTRRWDIVAWNGLMTRVFRDYATVSEPDRNLLRIIPTDQRYQSDMPHFEELAGRLLQEFRVDFGHLAFDRVSYIPEGNAFQRVLMFTPQDVRTARIVDSIRPPAPQDVEPDLRHVLRVSDTNVLRHSNRH